MEKRYPATGKIKRYCTAVLFLIACLVPLRFYAQQETEKPARILFLMDASSSMLNDWNSSGSRFSTAARLVMAIVDSVHAVNKDVAFAVRAFGTQFPAQDKNCYDTRLEVPFNLGNDEQIKARLKYLSPRGFSPIAWSLKETAEHDFTESNKYAYSIILITDGGESCGGDICATVTNLLSKKISFKPYILSLVDYEPLKLQYECLGKYLTVASEKDVVPAIRTIIDDNKKILSIKASGLRPVRQDVTPPVAAARIDRISLPVIKKEPEVVVPPPVKKEPPVPPVEAPVTLPKVVLFNKIYSRTKLAKMNLLYTLPEGIPVIVPRLGRISLATDAPAKLPGTVEAPVQAKATPPKKAGIIEPEATVTKPKTGSVKTIPPKKIKEDEKLDYVVKIEEAKESTLQIYFTNGNGKLYSTEPRLQIKDSKTGRDVRSVFRTQTGGEPDPIRLEPGTYDLVIPGAKSKATGILIEAGKNKKYYIKVNNSSLAFYYPTAPDRPVKEYTALVSKRFEPGPVVKQRCEEELPYDPTNYHIEINTLPPMMLNVDLEFNNTKLISIEESGTIQISNTGQVGKVQFWCQRGDTYVPFYEMTVSGNPVAQKASFLPGLYQVRYYKAPGSPLAKADVVLFRIKSNMTTTIELEK